MSILNKKIPLPLLVGLVGTVAGALSGQFVWTLVAAAGAAVLVSVVQNLAGFHRAIDGRQRIVSPDMDDLPVNGPRHSQDWLQQWDDEVTYSQVYEDTPGNIWNRSASASDH